MGRAPLAGQVSSASLEVDFRIVARQFADLVGVALPVRVTNEVANRCERADLTVALLADRAFDEEGFVARLTRQAVVWQRRCDCETTRALLGYAAYLRRDFGRAATCFMTCISLNSRNLDNWIDLAFACNHAGNPLGRRILFDFEEFIARYPGGMCSLGVVERLAAEIEADSMSYRHVWADYVCSSP